MSIEKFKDFRICPFETHYFCYLCPFFCTESYLLDTKLVTDHLFGKMAGWKYLQFDKTTGEFKRRFTTKRRPEVKKKPKKKTAIKKDFFDETTPNSCHADYDTNKQGEETPSIQKL